MYFFFLLVYRIKTNNNKKSYHGARSIAFFHLQKMCNNTTTIKTTIHLWKEITSVTESTVLPSNTAGRSSALGHQPLSFHPSPGGVLPATAPPTPRCLLQRNSASPGTAARSGIWARAVGASTALASPRRGPRHPRAAPGRGPPAPPRRAPRGAARPAPPPPDGTAPGAARPPPAPAVAPGPADGPSLTGCLSSFTSFRSCSTSIFSLSFSLRSSMLIAGMVCAARARREGGDEGGRTKGYRWAARPSGPEPPVGRWDGGAAAPGPPPASLTRCRRAAPRRPLPPHRAGHPAPRRPAFKLRANPL